MSLATGTRLGTYEILGLLGAGGMGEVYRARDGKLQRDVAIKILPPAFASDPDRLARFEREAQVLASLNHPNIAAIYGFVDAGAAGAFPEPAPAYTSDGGPVPPGGVVHAPGAFHGLVLELVDGPTLADRIAEGAIPLDEALPIARQIAEALEAAHEAGVIHRDLKPANIKLRPDGTVKVLDFGLAKLADPIVGAGSWPDVTASPTITSPALMTGGGVILGTAAYMSPEQARGKPVDRRTDIWAFGCVLYEMLTGRRPFAGEDVGLTLAEIMKSEPAWGSLPPNLPGSAHRLLRRCLDKDPRRRLRDSGEARIALEDIQAGHIEAGETRPRPVAQRPWPWMTASAVLLLILAAVVVFTGSAPSFDRTLRYSIALPPEALTFSFALSPDGRYVAVESVVGRNTQVFLRSLDSDELRPIPGTENVSNPFWSPDSRHIAFFADQKLKRVSVSGGPPEELADVPGLFGARGTWGRGGVIIVAGSSKYDRGPLRRVAETGGDLSPLTTTPPGETHRFPQFLPDGDHFLYTSLGGSSPGIYLASLDDPAGQRLLADISSAHLAMPAADGRPAQLLFMRAGNLMAQVFDLDSLAMAGDPVMLLEQQPPGLVDDGMASVSVDETGMLVYAGGSFRETNSRFAWFDRSGILVAHVGPIGPEAPAGLSPDESAIVVARRLPGQWQSDLWRRDLARGSEQRLTFQTLSDVASNVVWSPDGSRIVFSMSPVFDLFSMNPLATSPPQGLFTSDRPKYPTDWSDDGQYLLYTELGGETVADLWYLRLENAAGGEARVAEAVPFLQTPFLESGGTLTPDGRWIAYVSDESGDREVYVRPFPGGAGHWKVSSGRGAHPRWSADGRELFYLTGPASRLTLMRTPVTRRVPESRGTGAVFEFGGPEPLFTLSFNSYHPATGTFFYAPSRDGSRFLVNYIDLTEGPVLHVVTNWQRAFGLVPAN